MGDLMRLETNAAINPVDVTSEVCRQKHCQSAWRTDVGTFPEFDQEGDAQYWETVLGDESRRNERILVDFSDHQLNREQVKRAVDTLFSDRDWA